MIYKHDPLKCGIVLLLSLVRFDNQLVLDKVILILTMENTISKKIYVKASLAKPPPTDKTLGIDPAILFCAIEDGDGNEKGEEAEILVIYYSSLAAFKQNLVNRNFPYIDTFDHEGPAVISAMRNLTVVVFEHLDITSHINLDKMLAYTQRTLRGDAHKKYREVLVI